MYSDDSTKPKGNASQIFANGDGAKPSITQTIFLANNRVRFFHSIKAEFSSKAST